MGAPELLGTQVDSRVRLTYCLGHMQIQGLDSLEGLPTAMSQACLMFPSLLGGLAHDNELGMPVAPLFERLFSSLGDIFALEYYPALFTD